MRSIGANDNYNYWQRTVAFWGSPVMNSAIFIDYCIQTQSLNTNCQSKHQMNNKLMRQLEQNKPKKGYSPNAAHVIIVGCCCRGCVHITQLSQSLRLRAWRRLRSTSVRLNRCGRGDNTAACKTAPRQVVARTRCSHRTVRFRRAVGCHEFYALCGSRALAAEAADAEVSAADAENAAAEPAANAVLVLSSWLPAGLPSGAPYPCPCGLHGRSKIAQSAELRGARTGATLLLQQTRTHPRHQLRRPPQRH